MTFRDYFTSEDYMIYTEKTFEELTPVLPDIRAFEYCTSGGCGVDGGLLLISKTGNVFPVWTLIIDHKSEETTVMKSPVLDTLLMYFPLDGKTTDGWTVTDLSGGMRIGTKDPDAYVQKALWDLKHTVTDDHPAVRIFGNRDMAKDSTACVGFAEAYSRMVRS